MVKAQLGVCYYPEHWDESLWESQAISMYQTGIRLVRIGEFSWSQIEPRKNWLTWDWLDRAIAVLADNGLNIILGTPTACPPRWLIQMSPEILPVDSKGETRTFGSRRHYCFSSPVYRREVVRIVAEMAKRYGRNPAVVGWQLDNEYGCHDTTLSYSPAALTEFRRWLSQEYGDIKSLNDAWGNRFWSQVYDTFEQVELPNATVTEANPAHQMDFVRFSSDQVVSFNRLQRDTLKQQQLPNRPWITHNFMGNFVDFDHYDVAKDLDLATWDSYPLGFLQQSWLSDDEKKRYRRIGHPDWAAFHHDLYRGVGSQRFGVMEQQPGPVNWANYNASPLPGAVRFWTWEAIAHGAEFVSYFRWQQYPKAQEQMHAGLNLPDGQPAPAKKEIQQTFKEFDLLPGKTDYSGDVALLFDYQSCWMAGIQDPHIPVLPQVFDYYRALRSLGFNIDIVNPEADLSDYKLIVIPSLWVVSETLVKRLKSLDIPVLIGPRSGSKRAPFGIPPELPPASLRQLIDLSITGVDAIHPQTRVAFDYLGHRYWAHSWIEEIRTAHTPLVVSEDNRPCCYRQNKVFYVAALTETGFLTALLKSLCNEFEIPYVVLPEDLRTQRLGQYRFVFNFGEAQSIQTTQKLLLGQTELNTADLAIWNASE